MARHVQLNNIEHADLRIRRERGAALGDAVMWSPAFPQEFRLLQPHYPIIFAKDAASGGYRPIALFGFEDGENLFLDLDGWDAAYIPLAMRMRPFLIGFSAGAGGARQVEVHLDLDHPRVSRIQGERVFLDHGGHSDFLREVSALLGEVHDGESASPAFCALLEEMELIEPFTFDATLKDGTQGRLAGYFTIAEERLEALDGAALERLHAAGALQAVFMAVASLSQLSALVERRNARVAEAV